MPVVQFGEVTGEQGGAAAAQFCRQCGTGGSDVDADDALVVGVGGPGEQPGVFEFAHHARTHGGVEPFDLREFADSDRLVAGDGREKSRLRTRQPFLRGEHAHAAGDPSDRDTQTVDVFRVERRSFGSRGAVREFRHGTTSEFICLSASILLSEAERHCSER